LLVATSSPGTQEVKVDLQKSLLQGSFDHCITEESFEEAGEEGENINEHGWIFIELPRRSCHRVI